MLTAAGRESVNPTRSHCVCVERGQQGQQADLDTFSQSTDVTLSLNRSTTEILTSWSLRINSTKIQNFNETLTWPAKPGPTGLSSLDNVQRSVSWSRAASVTVIVASCSIDQSKGSAGCCTVTTAYCVIARTLIQGLMFPVVVSFITCGLALDLKCPVKRVPNMETLLGGHCPSKMTDGYTDEPPLSSLADV
ncbi:hypothetical protein RRG08_048639 [Elysia crispata]|uniref:Uncharacterized protein n=1 Tax=Elysia crispata TaxID=231223 RepID=A0AAE1DX15_9GAST|nr:hypothetical protein RRG08_048639 [Elysia crispata]